MNILQTLFLFPLYSMAVLNLNRLQVFYFGSVFGITIVRGKAIAFLIAKCNLSQNGDSCSRYQGYHLPMCPNSQYFVSTRIVRLNYTHIFKNILTPICPLKNKPVSKRLVIFQSLTFPFQFQRHPYPTYSIYLYLSQQPKRTSW